MLANHIFNKGLISKIKKELIRLDIKKKKLPTTKSGQKIGNTHFSKDYIQMVHGYTERCSTSLVLREMQIKTAMRYHLIP